MPTRASEHHLLPDAEYATFAGYLADDRRALDIDAIDPNALLETLLASGLRGRGGAGFPAGVKWQSVANHACPKRYVVCNAAEGEPGTFKDRYLLGKNPYAVIEGVALAAHTIHAEKAYIAMKASFTRELARVRRALSEMRAQGTLGDLEIEVVEGPEEYLFGEEKALLNVIEGEGPLPREADEPPYEVGLFATVGSPNPALVSNAETFAHASTLARFGAASFRALGTPDTPGTLLVTLSGDVARPGVYEVEAGWPLARLFDELGGGSKDGGAFKAALSGVSAKVILPPLFATPAAFGPMRDAGIGLGSAGFMLYGASANMARVTQALARFLFVESCNQCPSCKLNLGVASATLDELFEVKRKLDVEERALLAARRAPQGNRCYLPVQGSVLIPSLIRAFSAELDEEARSREHAPPYVVPKLTAFDEATRVFSIDEAQQNKLPNWTYREPPPPSSLPSKPLAVPPPPPHHEEVAVWLAPDVVSLLRAHAPESPVEHAANQALREWSKKRS